MKNNKLFAIFLLHILSALILLSCSLEVTNDDDEKEKNEKANIKITKKENKSSKIKKMSKSSKHKNSKANNLPAGVPAAVSKLKNQHNANNSKQIIDPEAQELIRKILERAANINQIIDFDSNRNEPDDQFGMKKDVFSKIFFSSNATVTLDKNEYLAERRMIYTSLKFQKAAISGIGKILSKLSQDSNYLDLAKAILINRGFSIQLTIEKTNFKIWNVKDKIQQLNKSNLKALYYDFNKLIQFKENWIKDVDDMITEYNNNPELKTNIARLNDYLNSKNPKALLINIHNVILNLKNKITNILAPIQ
ncbi:complement regulator-acquiring protein (plasmid) [Borreliella turdi]|uniref:complement regulator-acquiring protein n=1 Tax=Borreliella turdi TaxID=57863 RepID=UPI002649B6C5|nr:complement regulator-acquiring protein [Borreliella turdi]WKC77585.1 complement regulator-acquiring protein [Borreliella turdi]